MDGLLLTLFPSTLRIQLLPVKPLKCGSHLNGTGVTTPAPAKDVNLFCFFSNDTQEDNTTETYNFTEKYVANYDFNSQT